MNETVLADAIITLYDKVLEEDSRFCDITCSGGTASLKTWHSRSQAKRPRAEDPIQSRACKEARRSPSALCFWMNAALNKLP